MRGCNARAYFLRLATRSCAFIFDYLLFLTGSNMGVAVWGEHRIQNFRIQKHSLRSYERYFRIEAAVCAGLPVETRQSAEANYFAGLRRKGAGGARHASDGVIGYTRIARQLISISHFASCVGKRYDKSCLHAPAHFFTFTVYNEISPGRVAARDRGKIIKSLCIYSKSRAPARCRNGIRGIFIGRIFFSVFARLAPFSIFHRGMISRWRWSSGSDNHFDKLPIRLHLRHQRALMRPRRGPARRLVTRDAPALPALPVIP